MSRIAIGGLLVLISLAFAGAPARGYTNAAVPDGTAEASSAEALQASIARLDALVFDAYNRCDMRAFAGYFDRSVEFYHDQGGASFDRATVVANTRKYICGKVRRELLPDSLRVYPIKDYGAIEEGEHRFCQLNTGKCEGIAKFVMIWRHHQGQWQLTRVLSYGHGAL